MKSTSKVKKPSAGVSGASSKESSELPLKNRIVFIDLPGQRGVDAFTNHLKLLGATVELCFSKDIRLLITNRGHPSDYRRSGASDRVDSPTAPSPFSLGSLRGVDSPLSPNTDPATNRPMTRGKAIALKVNLTKNFGSTNVVEMAKQWSIRTVHYEQMEKWVLDQLKKFPELTKSKKKTHSARKSKVKILKDPCVKFESTCGMYRPQKLEMEVFPAIDFKTVRGSCPFDLIKENKQKKKSSSSPWKDHRVKRLVTAGELRRMKERLRQGYCELCEEKYDNMRQHVRQENHKTFVSDDKNYKQLDELIALGPNIGTLLSKRDVLRTPTHSHPPSCSRRSTHARSVKRIDSKPSEASSPKKLETIRRKLCPLAAQVVIEKVESEADDGEEEMLVPDPIVLVEEIENSEDERRDTASHLAKKKYKKIHLDKKWSVISDRSMSKFLATETESEEFEGFTENYAAQDSFPSDVSYEVLNEILVSVNSEVVMNKENGVSSDVDASPADSKLRRSPRKLLQLTPKRPSLMELMDQHLGDTSGVASFWKSPSTQRRTSPRKKKIKKSAPETDDKQSADVYVFSESPLKSPKTPVKQIVASCSTSEDISVEAEGPWGDMRSPVSQQQRRKFFKTPESSRKSAATVSKPWEEQNF